MIKNLYLNDTIVGYNNPAGVTRMTVDTKTGRTCIIVKDRYNNERVIEISNETLEQKVLDLISANTEKIETISGQISAAIAAIPEIQEQLSGVINDLEDQQTGLSAAHVYINELSGIVTDHISGIEAINDRLNDQQTGLSAINENIKAISSQLYDTGIISSRLDILEQETIPYMSSVIDTKFIYKGSCKYDDLHTSSKANHAYSEYAQTEDDPISKQEWIANYLPKEFEIYNITDRDNKAYLYYQGEWILFGNDTISNETLSSNFNDLSDKIAAISGNTTNIFHFKGKVETKEELPTEGNVEGDVYLVGQTKEYVYTLISGFIEIGDQGSHITRKEVEDQIKDLSGAADLKFDYLSSQIDTKLTFKGLSSWTDIETWEGYNANPTDTRTFVAKKGDFYIEEETNRAWININGLSGIDNWRAIGIDGYTKTQIDEFVSTIYTNIDAETARALSVENELSSHISSEIERALSAETELDEKINAEQTRAENAENEVLNSANVYTDQKKQEAITSAKEYTVEQIEDLSGEVFTALSAQNQAALHYKGRVEWNSVDAIDYRISTFIVGDVIEVQNSDKEYLCIAPSTWIELGVDQTSLNRLLSSANAYTDEQILSTKQAIDNQISSAVESAQLYTNEQINSAVESASNYTNNQIEELSSTVDIKISETTTDIIGQIQSTSTYLTTQISDLTTNINNQLSGINDKLIGVFHYKRALSSYTELVNISSHIEKQAGDVYTIIDNENGEQYVEYVYTEDGEWVKLGSDNVASISASLSQEITTNSENITELSEKANAQQEQIDVIKTNYVPMSTYQELSAKYDELSDTLDNVIEILNSLSGIGVI